MTSAIFGLGALVEKWPWLVSIVRVLGSAWLLWFSVRFFKVAIQFSRADARIEKAPLERPFRFFDAVLFQWVNPKAIIIAASTAGAYIAIADFAWQRALIIVGVFFACGLLACTSWMVAGDALNRYMSSGKAATWMNFGMGILIVSTAVLTLLG